MKKKLYKIFYVTAFLLMVGFAVSFGIDAYKYNTYMGSAPLYTYAIIRTIEFIVPSIIVLTIGIFLKEKQAKK